VFSAIGQREPTLDPSISQEHSADSSIRAWTFGEITLSWTVCESKHELIFGDVTARILGFNTVERLLERQALSLVGRYPNPDAIVRMHQRSG
jgi:hypothetical protein